jgi:uncharacterized membrane protein
MDIWKAIGAGLLIAMRSMALPAVSSDYLARQPTKPKDTEAVPLLQRPDIAMLTKLMAAGEIAVDKTSLIPNRTDLLPIAGRMGVAGLFTALVTRQRDRIPAVIIAMLAAAVGTHLAFQARKLADEKLHLPDPIVAAIEDVIVVRGSILWRDTYLADQRKDA